MKIFIAIPAYDGKICVQTFTSLIGNISYLQARGHKVLIHTIPGDCYIQNARNKLVREFLKTDNDAMVFIDADMGFEDTAIDKLIVANEPLVFAGYPCKGKELWTARPLMDAEGNSTIKPNSLMLCESGPTGLMLIKRSVFSKMREAHPEWQLQDGHPFAYFETGALFDDNKWYGEDVAFCKRWVDLGGQCWCYTNIDVVHAGGGETKGNFYKFITERFKHE
jgi:hypothetical protein